VIRAGLLPGLLAALALGVVSTVSAHDEDHAVEVKVSRLANGRCGHLEESLQALVTRNGVRPGDVAGDVTVCVASTGDHEAVLTLHATELVELDPRCTGEEAAADATCGRGERGELAASLLQQVGLGPCPVVPATTTLARRLTELESEPLLLASRLTSSQLVCVRLRLRYEPVDGAAALASQSDRTFWRYAFTVTAKTKEE
jgi:hypothetical protein